MGVDLCCSRVRGRAVGGSYFYTFANEFTSRDPNVLTMTSTDIVRNPLVLMISACDAGFHYERHRMESVECTGNRSLLGTLQYL